MKILQVKIEHHGHEAWFDLMEVPETVNDLREFCDVANSRPTIRTKQSFRVVELLEGEPPVLDGSAT